MRDEQVVLLDRDGSVIGQSPKADVHHSRTPLHLAFSVHIFDPAGRVLLTRRALGKRTWPGVWTNSFCGHPRPAEPLICAVQRHAEDELGVAVTGIELALPLFRYRATDASGMVEHEICPVYIARSDGALRPDPDEMAEWRWVDPAALAAAVLAGAWLLMPSLGITGVALSWLVVQSVGAAVLLARPPSP